MTAPLHVLVTGASSGIGEALAHQYARHGARLALYARREDRLEAVARRCLDLGAGEARVLVGDVADYARVIDAAGELERAWPRVDRAFLNAGGSGEDKRRQGTKRHHLDCCSTEFTAEMVEHVIRINYLGVVYWMEPLLRRMRQQGAGTIAVTGAMAADRGLPRSGHYSASKAALRALIDGMRADAGRYGVRLCLLEPGFVKSELTDANCFKMPFIQPTERAAARFHRGVEAGERVIRFPWQWSVLSKLGAAVPRVLYDRWARRMLPPV
jgi:NAD(P)-dependent dehydrogenase (short-subunit alcohol dehydrogenase family)